MSTRGSCRRECKVPSADPAAPQNAVAIVEHDGLARRDTVLRLRELDADAGVPRAFDFSALGGVPVANLCRALELPRDVDQPVEAIGLEGVSRQLFARADHHLPGVRPDADDVARRTEGDPQ